MVIQKSDTSWYYSESWIKAKILTEEKHQVPKQQEVSTEKKKEWNRNVIKTSSIVTEQDLGQFEWNRGNLNWIQGGTSYWEVSISSKKYFAIICTLNLKTLQRESDPGKLIKMLLRFEHCCTSFIGLIKLNIFYKKDPYFLKKTNYLTRYSDKNSWFLGILEIISSQYLPPFS